MTITMYGIKNCDTIKKARAWLDSRGIAYAFHDYKTAGLDRKQLEDWTCEVGWEPLVNRAGTTFRKLADAEKTNLDEKKALALMLANPSLVKRPVLAIAPGANGANGASAAKARRLLVGFSPHAYAEALGSK